MQILLTTTVTAEEHRLGTDSASAVSIKTPLENETLLKRDLAIVGLRSFLILSLHVNWNHYF